MASPEEGESRGRGRRGPSPSLCGGPGGGSYRRVVLETAILSSLAEATAHGYDLMDRIEALTGGLVCVDTGSIYRLLRALEEDALVTSSWQTPEAGPSRRVYTLTERGMEMLDLTASSLAHRATAMQRLADHAAQALSKSQTTRSEVDD